MNDLVLATNPSPAIQELIKGWYASSPEFQNPNFVPPGWEHHPTNPNLDGEVKQLLSEQEPARDVLDPARSLPLHTNLEELPLVQP